MYALAVLLATSSPIGTGQSLHPDQLLDVLLLHVHFVSGQRIEVGDAVPIRNAATAMTGPALGAGAAAATIIAEALTPVPRAFEVQLPPQSTQRPAPHGVERGG